MLQQVKDLGSRLGSEGVYSRELDEVCCRLCWSLGLLKGVPAPPKRVGRIDKTPTKLQEALVDDAFNGQAISQPRANTA